jgi:hypothetical protein
MLGNAANHRHCPNAERCDNCMGNVGPSLGPGNGGKALARRVLPSASVVTLTTLMHLRTDRDNDIEMAVQLVSVTAMLILVAVGLVYRWSVGNFIPHGSTFIFGGRTKISFRENAC